MSSNVRITRRNPEALRKLKEAMEKLRAKGAHVGLPASTDGDLVMRGAVHQFGSVKQGIPARPWLDMGAKEGAPKYAKLAKNKITKVATGDLSVDAYYSLLGEIGKAEVQRYLVNGTFKPLSPTTIKRKGSSKPLIDTGQLRNSVTYEVR